MKILMDVRTLGVKPSGVGMYAYYMILALKKMSDYEIVMVSDICESEQLAELRDDYGLRLHIHGMVCAKSLRLVRYFRFVQQKIYEERPDIFWEPNILSPIPLHNPYGRMWMTIHDMFPITNPKGFDRCYPIFFRYGISISMRCFDEIIYNSNETKQETERYFNRAKKLRSYVAYMPVPSPQEKQEDSGEPQKDATGMKAAADLVGDASTKFASDVDRQEPDDNLPFLYVGNLEYRKGTDILLRSYMQYIKKGGTRQLRLAGKIREDDIGTLMRQVIEQVGADKLVYLGYVDDDDKIREMRNCGAFLFPSRAEGFGIPVIEAMCYNKPIITSDLSIFEEITDGAVRTVSLDGLADTMLKPLPEVDTEMYRRVQERYSLDSIGECIAKEMSDVARKFHKAQKEGHQV